jgi:preprotein translocase subunit SecE
MKNNKVTNYVRESVGELKKVTWPKKDEVVNSTVIVILVVIVISLILGIFDIGVKKIANFILGSK